MFGHEVENRTYTIALQLCDGSVRDLLAREGGFVDNRLGLMLKDVGAGLHYLYDKKVLHRDLKPENILYISGQGLNPETFLISDFGLSTPYKSHQSMLKDGCGSSEYLHPEILAMACYKGLEYGIYSDIHSLAVCIFEVITQRRPFQSNVKGLANRSEALLKLIKRKPKGSICHDGMKYRKYFESNEHNLQHEILTKRMELLLADMMDVSQHRHSKHNFCSFPVGIAHSVSLTHSLSFSLSSNFVHRRKNR